MSLSSFAKRLRRTRGNNSSIDGIKLGEHPSDGPSGSATSSRAGSAPPPHTPESNPPARPGTPTGLTIPTPQAVPPPMPIPEPVPALPPPTTLAVEPTHAMDSALAELAPMNIRLSSGPSIERLDRTLDTMGDKIDNLTNKANKAMSVVNGATQIVSALEQTDLAQKVERGIRRFADDIPWLMKGLDEVARIHPAVTVAVLAFKAIYALESTRQENDRRVMTLYVEMKDMMIVMVQLKGIESRTHIGLDGRVLKDRLEELAEKTAENIKDCANLCDTFLKKKLLVKVFKGPAWAERLAAFVQVFADRKADFQFALAMHTANSLTDVKKQNSDIDAKLDIVLVLFRSFVSTEERKIASEIDSKGGFSKVRKDDDVLKSLLALEASMQPGSVVSGQGEAETQLTNARRDKVTTKQKSFTLDELKVELREDVEDALEKNFETFIGKFELQVSMLQVALELYIQVENDRVIGAVTDVIQRGPHMKIKDSELRRIWQYMNWRGNVKARLFVMTLQDHYRDQFENAVQVRGPSRSGVVISDEWALEYLGTSWLQPIMEAFDDDASGYVTITEVNRLMDLRPASLGWSIPHWLAYWAVGWTLAADMYIRRMRAILSRMRDAIPTVLPRNRKAIDDYFSVWWWIVMLVLGIYDEDEDVSLRDRFAEYIEAEEQRIRTNLTKVKYNIDALDTLALVIGAGRLETSIFPLLYLLLKNDWRKFRAAQTIVLENGEMRTSQQSIERVFNAVNNRRTELERLFIERGGDWKKQIEKFAFGLFKHLHDDNKFWEIDNQQNPFFAYVEPPELEPTNLDLEGIPENKASPLDTSWYEAIDEETEDDLLAPERVKRVLGQWNGFPYDANTYPIRTMLSLNFHYSTKEGEDFKASGIEFDGDPFEISGVVETESDDGKTKLKWTMSYPGDLTIYYFGILQDQYTITGTRSYGSPEEFDWLFVLKKIPAEYMTYFPSPHLPAQGKYRALWRYAIEATLHDVRRRKWTWSYFKARRDIRKGYITFSMQRFGRPIIDWAIQYQPHALRSTAKDVRFYESICTYLGSTLPFHGEVLCDNRDADGSAHYIERARYICLDCIPWKQFFNRQISFCDDPVCYNTTVLKGPLAEQSHYPTHDFVKVRQVVHRLQWPSLASQTRSALAAARGVFSVELPTLQSPSTPAVSEQPDPSSSPIATAEGMNVPPGSTVPSGDSTSSASEDKGAQVNASSLPEGSGVPTLSVTEESHIDRSSQPSASEASDIGKQHQPKGSTDKASLADTRDLQPKDSGIDIHALAQGGPEKSDSRDVRVSPSREDQNVQAPGAQAPEVAVVDVLLTSVGQGDDWENHSNVVDDLKKCKICDQHVLLGMCWYCVDCFAFICDDCERSTLITCWSCRKPFPQRRWYPGFNDDDFTCDVCCARGVGGAEPGVDSVSRATQPSHNYTHPLVQCKPKVLDPPDSAEPDPNSEETLADRRFASLEQRIAVMDSRFEKLQDQFSRLEEKLDLHLEKSQEALQAVLLTKFTETLKNILSGRETNGQAK